MVAINLPKQSKLLAPQDLNSTWMKALTFLWATRGGKEPNESKHNFKKVKPLKKMQKKSKRRKP